MTAERTVSVNVVTDSNAFLALSGTDERVSQDANGQLQIDFASGYNNNSTGLNPDARTAFHDLFEVQNNGQNDVAFSVGVAKNQVGIDNPPAGTSAPSSGSLPDLLQDYAGINVVYAYDETDSEGNANSTGIGNPSANKLDAGGRVWRTSGQEKVLTPGQTASVDLSIETGDSFDPSTLSESDVGLYAFAVETGGERDITGST
ncbi:hypothetical protein DU500_13135 [Haloplanus rubicundus]|uniref:DUF1102 domain-containing protein n=1 Tax=Haloplanus rubicundus TaxID=1547898 RepID=A0A345E519_9EURY|nr:hypothetical protein DU500_13135 [Haloplanus rubicundus]AXG10692.1 hypothetical protein DU484_13035 [Haloplanus rubicundus]